MGTKTEKKQQWKQIKIGVIFLKFQGANKHKQRKK